MKKILVPFDFSIIASNGFYYAHDLAAAIGAELVVMHMYLPYSDTSVIEDYQSVDVAEAKTRREQILMHLKAATQLPIGQQDSDVEVSYIVDYGEKNAIAQYAKLHKADLIVMGTGGAGSLQKTIGTNTTTVLEEAICPVLVVPQGVKFQDNMAIAYATDLTSSDVDSLKSLAQVAELTNSKIHCVHVNKFSGVPNRLAEETFEALLKDRITNVTVSFSTWSAMKVEEGLEMFCRVNNINLLSVLKHKQTTWEKVFGEKSMTKTLALKKNIPLLAFRD
jgi:nucleotide-binding universal stress UspA family protein